MTAAAAVRQVDVTFRPPSLVLALLRAAPHDRPPSWACREGHRSTTALRPAGLPSPSALSRRLRSVAVGVPLRHPADRLRGRAPARLVQALDGQPRPVGGARHDPDARNGHGAGKIAKGSAPHAVRGGRPAPAAWSVEPMNVGETRAAERRLPELAGGGDRGDLLADGAYDANPVSGAAGAAGYRLVAPRADPEAGLGHIRRPRDGVRRGPGAATGVGPAVAPGVAVGLRHAADQRRPDREDPRAYGEHAIS